MWARWAAAALGEGFGAALAADPALTSQAPLRNWAETVVKQVRARARGCAQAGTEVLCRLGRGVWHSGAVPWNAAAIWCACELRPMRPRLCMCRAAEQR